jgi:hypothetical protein
MTDDNEAKSEQPAANPYVERGLILSPSEYDLITGALTELAEKADRENAPQIRPACIKLIVRMKQIVHAGEGMTPEVAERYGRRIVKSMEDGDPVAISRNVGDMLAASLRLEADPADKIGEMLANLASTTAAEMGRAAVTISLQQLGQVLAESKDAWAKAGWTVTAEEVVTWATDLVSLGAQNVADGFPPWAFDDAAADPGVVEAAEPTPAEPKPA